MRCKIEKFMSRAHTTTPITPPYGRIHGNCNEISVFVCLCVCVLTDGIRENIYTYLYWHMTLQTIIPVFTMTMMTMVTMMTMMSTATMPNGHVVLPTAGAAGRLEWKLFFFWGLQALIGRTESRSLQTVLGGRVAFFICVEICASTWAI